MLSEPSTSSESPLKRNKNNEVPTLFCWGSHSYGQLGLGKDTDHYTLPEKATRYQVCTLHFTMTIFLLLFLLGRNTGTFNMSVVQGKRRERKKVIIFDKWINDINVMFKKKI